LDEAIPTLNMRTIQEQKNSGALYYAVGCARRSAAKQETMELSCCIASFCHLPRQKIHLGFHGDAVGTLSSGTHHK
jgi:hypothetical protein